MKRIFARGLVAVALSACAPADTSINRDEGTEGLRGLEFDQPFEAPEFTLLDTAGDPFDFQAETAGSLALLFFGYTHCPDICPVQMAVLDAALDDLAYRERTAVQVVFVTTDPERDTPEALREWLDRFDRAFVGLTGESEVVDEILAGFQLPASMIEGPEDRASADEYMVGHATPVVAITGDGIVRALYPSGIRQTDWKHDLPLLLTLNESVSGEPAGAGTG